jgi:membrane protease YdiL (CAAX protease family)
MEELLANADEQSLWIYRAFGMFLLFGGAYVALMLGLLHRRNPPDHRALTAAIATRSWNTPELGLALAALLLLYLLAALIPIPFLFIDSPEIGVALAGILSYIATFMVVARIHRKRGGSWVASFGLGGRQMKTLLLSPVFYLATAPFLLLATAAWHLLLEQGFGMEIELQETMQLIAQGSFWLKFLYVLLAVVAAPLFEELVFRGLLFPYLVKRAGLAGGTVLVSALFALIHLHTPSLAPIFLLSAALCLAYWRTGSLWVAIGMHAIFNATSILALIMMG